MSLTRKMLKAMGIEEEKIDQIIDAHSETVDGLKAEIAKHKDSAEKLPKVQKELDDLKAAGDGGYKEKYETEKAAFEKYKGEITAKELQSAKEKAYREILKDASLSEKGIEKAIKYADWSKVELESDGKLKGATDHIKTVKEEWAEYVTTTTQKGISTPSPVRTGGGDPTDLGSLDMAAYIAARSKK
jgi:hypothetical protein